MSLNPVYTINKFKPLTFEKVVSENEYPKIVNGAITISSESGFRFVKNQNFLNQIHNQIDYCKAHSLNEELEKLRFYLYKLSPSYNLPI